MRVFRALRPGRAALHLTALSATVAVALVLLPFPTPAVAGVVSWLGWNGQDPRLRSQTGVVENGGTRSANTGEHGEGYLVYGPYETNRPEGPVDGTCLAANWVLSIDNNTADSDAVMTLDVHNNTRGRVLASQVVRRTDFTAAMPATRLFVLQFRNADALPGDELEFRAYWHDRAAMRVHDVVLQRVSTEDCGVTEWRGPALPTQIGARQDGDTVVVNTAEHGFGFLNYGPYVPVRSAGDAGTCLEATWDLSIDNNTADNDEVLTLDIRDDSADRVLASQVVRRTDFRGVFPAGQMFSLRFNSADVAVGDRLEFRTVWHDRAWMQVRTIALRKVSGGSCAGSVPIDASVALDLPAWIYGRNTDCLSGQWKANLKEHARLEREGKPLSAEQAQVLLSLIYGSGSATGGKATCLDQPLYTVPGWVTLDLGQGGGLQTLPANLLLDSPEPLLSVSTTGGTTETFTFGNPSFLVAGNPAGPGGGIQKIGPSKATPSVGQAICAFCLGVGNLLGGGEKLLRVGGPSGNFSAPGLTNPSGLQGAPPPPPPPGGLGQFGGGPGAAPPFGSGPGGGGLDFDDGFSNGFGD